MIQATQILQVLTHRLKQPGRPHPATHAHGDDAVTQIASLQLTHEMPDLTRTGHAERMADGNRAAIDVVLVVIDLQPITAVQALRGERFVEFPQIDVGNPQPLGLEQFRHREHRADAHFVRLATRPR